MIFTESGRERAAAALLGGRVGSSPPRSALTQHCPELALPLLVADWEVARLSPRPRTPWARRTPRGSRAESCPGLPPSGGLRRSRPRLELSSWTRGLVPLVRPPPGSAAGERLAEPLSCRWCRERPRCRQ